MANRVCAENAIQADADTVELATDPEERSNPDLGADAGVRFATPHWRRTAVRVYLEWVAWLDAGIGHARYQPEHAIVDQFHQLFGAGQMMEVCSDHHDDRGSFVEFGGDGPVGALVGGRELHAEAPQHSAQTPQRDGDVIVAKRGGSLRGVYPQLSTHNRVRASAASTSERPSSGSCPSCSTRLVFKFLLKINC
ncbi:hypothetical protein GCM10009678_68390 [Actinomadura kijaniata]|uniref:Uncharacterized protein n=1 Tax=Actinomadura namibiensis TaxID=182080 RepID=A0A7W3QRX1_ACTNM|nr:hypothetical protein [Actinomadura namibiensis]MBA8956803.1 hypothetical protein [Actinomadura namibiensis]